MCFNKQYTLSEASRERRFAGYMISDDFKNWSDFKYILGYAGVYTDTAPVSFDLIYDSDYGESDSFQVLDLYSFYDTCNDYTNTTEVAAVYDKDALTTWEVV
jgi:hypothetical protein